MEGSPIMVLADMAGESKLQQDLTIYGSEVTARDIKTQASFNTEKAAMQSAIFRANATLKQSMGTMRRLSLAPAAPRPTRQPIPPPMRRCSRAWAG